MTSPLEEIKKRRVHRSPEKILELVMEAERTANSAAVCHRENISPQLMSRWKNQVKEAAIAGLKQIKSGRPGKQKSAESYVIQGLKEELVEVKEALVHTSMELSLLKKRSR